MTVHGELLRALAAADEARDAELKAALMALATRIAALEKPVVVPPVVVPPTGVFNLPALAADPIPALAAKPEVGGSYIDPVYKTKVTHAAKGRHNYSRRSPFNADSSRLLIEKPDGQWELWDTAASKLIRVLSSVAGDCEAIWHPTDPKKLLHTGRDGVGGIWYWLDVEANARTVAFNLTGKTPFPNAKSFWTKGEGTTSADGKYLALMCETYTNTVTHYGFVCVDVTTGAVVGSLVRSERPDHISMSPSGKWVVASGDGASGTRAYSRDFGMVKQLHSKSEHSDLALGPSGEDYYVFANYVTGQIEAKNIETLASINLAPIYPVSGDAYALHISGQAFERPGWVVISTYDDSSKYNTVRPASTLQPQYRKVWLAELKQGGQKLSVCHIRGSGTDYPDEPQAAPNRTLTKIAFATNLGAGASDTFVAEVPFK